MYSRHPTRPNPAARFSGMAFQNSFCARGRGRALAPAGTSLLPPFSHGCFLTAFPPGGHRCHAVLATMPSLPPRHPHCHISAPPKPSCHRLRQPAALMGTAAAIREPPPLLTTTTRLPRRNVHRMERPRRRRRGTSCPQDTSEAELTPSPKPLCPWGWAAVRGHGCPAGPREGESQRSHIPPPAERDPGCPAVSPATAPRAERRFLTQKAAANERSSQ